MTHAVMQDDAGTRVAGLTYTEAGVRVGVSESRIRQLVKRGRLIGALNGDGTLDPDRLERLFGSNRTKPTPPPGQRRKPRGADGATAPPNEPTRSPVGGEGLLELQEQKLRIRIRRDDLDLREREAELIERRVAKAAILDMGQATVNTIESFPPRWAATLAAEFGIDQRRLLVRLEAVAADMLTKLTGAADAAAGRT